MPRTNVPLVPKDPDGPLRVLILGRISTTHQDLENIEASYRFVEDYLAQIYRGPVHLKHLGERGSGMLTDRATIREAEDEIATGTWDLVIAEDLSRFYRNPRHQYAFVQDAVDAETRVICIGDNLDTADEDWEVTMGAASLRHGLHIPDTRRRVRRTARHAFHRGGMVQKVRFGYRRLTREEAESGRHGPGGLILARRPECTPILQELRHRVLQGDSYRALADWLNDEKVAPGPYVRRGKWTDRVVTALLRDPILHGVRTYGDVIGTPHYATGKNKRRKNPDGPETESYPELAHLTSPEHEELIRAMDERAKARTTATGPAHPLYNRPRSRVPWPAQHPRCAICGARMHRYIGDQLRCHHSFAHGGETCWNHVQVHGPAILREVLAWLVRHCEQVPDFRATLVDAAWDEFQAQRRRGERDRQAGGEESRELERRAANLAGAIGRAGEIDALVRELADVDRRLQAARRRQAGLAAPHPEFASRADVGRHLEAALQEVARNSFAFADLMRRIFPVFVIQPVQALDSGLVRPRARLVLRLDAPAEGPGAGGQADPRPGDVAVELDLFDPPVHIAAIPACVAARRADPTRGLRKLAAALGLGYMTVKRALRYARLMDAEGLTEPYRVLTVRPDSASRWTPRNAG